MYLLLQKYGDSYNKDVLRDRFEEIGLVKFEEQIRSLVVNLFGGNELSELQRNVYMTLMFSGIYGNTEQSAANQLVAVQLENVFPSQVHTLKYSLVNRSTAENVITFKLGQDTLDDDSIAMLSTFSARLGTVSAADTTSVGTVTFGDKIYFADYVSGNTIADVSNGTLSDVVIPAAGGTVTIDAMVGQDTPSNHLDFWLQLEMEPYEVLAARDSFTMTESEYNALQGKTADFPNLYIYFEIVYKDQ
jgi:hypothetical protein